MQTRSSNNPLNAAARWMAICAVGMLLVGRQVHLSQECGGCCGSGQHCETVADSSKPHAACPFGCEHHGPSETAGPEDDQSDGGRGHDEHQCSICWSLSTISESPAVVGLDQQAQLQMRWLELTSAEAASVELLTAAPRGPPGVCC